MATYIINGRKIVTSRQPPPCPHHWTAVDDDTYDYDQPIGCGATEQEAIADLLEMLAE